MDPAHVSLLDCTVQNVSSLPGPLLDGVALHGLVISSGEIKEIHNTAFKGLAAPLQALGLPNNQLVTVPIAALKYLPELDRLDLSSNKLKVLDSESFQVGRYVLLTTLLENISTYSLQKYLKKLFTKIVCNLILHSKYLHFLYPYGTANAHYKQIISDNRIFWPTSKIQGPFSYW